MNRSLTISLITLFVLSPVFLPSCVEKHNTSPVALFTIDPPYGNVDSVFVFDASECRDIEDPGEVLEVRWDWESDSIFDTDYSTLKSIEHQFLVGGKHYITLEVKDTKGLTARTTDFIRVSWTNRAPNASFNVSPGAGYLQDIFVFDASSSSDLEDNNASLNVRWDFDGDGSWDTEYSEEKVAEHQYSQEGSYDVKLEVIDSEDLLGEITYTLVVGGMNEAPNPPSTPLPSHDDGAASTACVLEWTCVDPENDQLLYDVYFGTSQNPTKVASDIEESSYACLPLEYTTDYYWKIVAKDPYDHVVEGTVWHFTTNTPVNEMGSFTDPRDNKVYKTVIINDKLWMAENLNIGSMINASTGGDNGDGYQRNNSKTEKFCYKNDEKYCDIYGGLYQWDEAMGFSEVEGAEGICPPGWHMPTYDEWRELTMYYEEDLQVAAGENLVLGSLSGFQIYFSGYMIFAERKYYDLEAAGYLWSSTINPDINHLALGQSIYRGLPEFQDDTYQRVNGLPVRCMKDY
ncbi:MAG: hypothetical protein HN686_05905 [Bacteroidetes bacterium]|nr:hypothetical protein [Bacteroidota bacterium]